MVAVLDIDGWVGVGEGLFGPEAAAVGILNQPNPAVDQMLFCLNASCSSHLSDNNRRNHHHCIVSAAEQLFSC